MPRLQNFADFHVKRRIIKNCTRIGHANQHPQLFVLIPVTPDSAQRIQTVFQPETKPAGTVLQRRASDPGDYPVQSRVRLFGNKLFAVVEQEPATIAFAIFPDK